MSIAKLTRFLLLSCALLLAALACGELLDNGDKDGSKRDSLDPRVPSGWNGAEDWNGSDWEVTEE